MPAHVYVRFDVAMNNRSGWDEWKDSNSTMHPLSQVPTQNRNQRRDCIEYSLLSCGGFVKRLVEDARTYFREQLSNEGIILRIEQARPGFRNGQRL